MRAASERVLRLTFLEDMKRAQRAAGTAGQAAPQAAAGPSEQQRHASDVVAEVAANISERQRRVEDERKHGVLATATARASVTSLTVSALSTPRDSVSGAPSPRSAQANAAPAPRARLASSIRELASSSSVEKRTENRSNFGAASVAAKRGPGAGPLKAHRPDRN
jgi:hypothetical protein